MKKLVIKKRNKNRFETVAAFTSGGTCPGCNCACTGTGHAIKSNVAATNQYSRTNRPYV